MLVGSRSSGGLIEIRVLTGGSNYSSPPVVSISGAGGAGAAGVAVMAGTRVESVIITNAGTGFTGSPSVTFSAATGSGASAVAYAHSAALRPMSFFKGRFGTVYGVDGMGRGVRWTGGTSSAQPIGLHKPAVAPTVAAGATSPGRRAVAIQLVDGGQGYASAPTVSITGGTPITPATAQAVVANGRVVNVRVTDAGEGYQSQPTVNISGGIGSGATFTVGAQGSVNNFRVSNTGSGYTSVGPDAPVITIASSNGLTQFQALVNVDAEGRVTGVNILNGGTGATAAPAFTVSASAGTGAEVIADVAYSVHAVTVGNSGNGYFTPPVVSVIPAAQDNDGLSIRQSAELEAAVSADGHVSGVTVINGGVYSLPPTALIIDTEAKAQASLAEPLRGKYLCCIRYIDDTARELGGPLASSISHLVEVDAGKDSGSFQWSFSHPYVDARVTAMELWRTTADQSVLLFRVATIQKTSASWSGTYQDVLSDDELSDSAREGYGLMPITLPSGQINARRFDVPPGRFAVGVMFQDRAWYAADSTGRQPNSLYYSEVDEPESVPEANELVLQENTDTPDSIVGLVPLGPSLLVAQSSHLYRLMYVAQPVLDASLMLVAHRGVLNSRCWAVMAGVAFLADSIGIYAYDGGQEQSISVAVDNFWRDQIIDFSKADKFHVSADHLTRTVRFYYCRSGDAEPVRALCYCVATQAWWEEVYPVAVTAVASVPLGGQLRRALGGADGAWRKESGTQDGSSSVPYSVRTGNLALTDQADRSVEITYRPTLGNSEVNIGLHYNNADSARPNAIHADRGTGFTVAAGGPATLNMKKTRSALGEATGSATANYAGRRSDRSSGGDQHIAVALSGDQGADAVALFRLAVKGAV